jgi:Domain of unknown function (DUF202)
MSDVPWDPGLQNERTGLSWQRTLLSGLTCSLLVARLLASVSIVLAVAIGIAALASTAFLGVLGIRRYVANHAALVGNQTIIPGTTTHLMVSALVALTAIGALAYAVLP